VVIEAVVVAAEPLHRILLVLLVVLQHEHVVLHPLAPPVVRFLTAARIGELVGIGLQRFVGGEVHRLGENLVDHLHPLVDPLNEPVLGFVGEAHVAGLHEVVEFLALLHELIDIRLIEIELHRIERFQEQLHRPLGDFVVERMPCKMLLVEQVGHRPRNGAIVYRSPGILPVGSKLPVHARPGDRDGQGEE
jgi:hypothetical protein